MGREWDDGQGWSDGHPDDWGAEDWDDYLGGPDDDEIASWNAEFEDAFDD